MKIAYISYEYPPDIGFGGIATYIYQISRLMKQRGHYVEIFCGSLIREITEIEESIMVHRILVKDPIDFRIKVLNKFEERNRVVRFDLFETPEINGNGFLINEKYPLIPMVVKIHMPAVLQIRLFNYYTPFFNKLRFVVSSLLKKGKFDLGLWSSHDKNQSKDIDYLITEKATVITTPSQAMKDWAISFWRISESRIRVVPLPYIPSKEFLEIPFGSDHKRITFVGKLNVHKGLVKYAEAIIKILKKYPDYKFRFIAMDGPSHKPNMSMKQYLTERLKNYIDSLEFIGSVPLTEIQKHLSITEICVFPSIWECFGIVVCEAMAAGRPVIVSNNGGMKEIVENNYTGMVVNPQSPKLISKAIELLITNKTIAHSMAVAGRKSILEKYNSEKIGRLNEMVYKEALNYAHSLR